MYLYTTKSTKQNHLILIYRKMETNITPLKETMLKRKANYLSSGSAQLRKFTPGKGQDLNQPYSREQQLCRGTMVPATPARQRTPSTMPPQPNADGGGRVSPAQPTLHQDSAWHRLRSWLHA